MSAAADPAVARLLRTLGRSFDGEAWHGSSLAMALAGCTAEEAAARPVPDAHSVWELVLHAAAWADEVTARTAGGRPGMPAAGDWPAVPSPADDAAWAAARAELDAARDRLLAAVAGVDPGRLDAPLAEPTSTQPNVGGDGTGRRDTLHETIVGLAEHNAYHGGQIVLLRKAYAAGARA